MTVQFHTPGLDGRDARSEKKEKERKNIRSLVSCLPQAIFNKHIRRRCGQIRPHALCGGKELCTSYEVFLNLNMIRRGMDENTGQS